jgi:MSHA type pilus biogenesis protein MshL
MKITNFSKKKHIGLALSISLLTACTSQPIHVREENKLIDAGSVETPEAIAAEFSEDSRSRQARLAELFEQKTPIVEPPPIEAPKYNPLDEITVDLIADNGELQYVLKALAEQAGLSLIIHPNLIGSSYRVTADFRGVKATTVLEQLARITDIHAEIDGNTLVINPLEERVFQLSYMETDTQSQFSSGGDVLGGSNGGSSGGGGTGQIQGRFTYSGTSMPNSNGYDQLENMLVTIIGESAGSNSGSNLSGASSIEEISMLSRLGTAIRSDMPTYSLNRVTGTLYVRAKPSAMKAAAHLITSYDAIMNKQILIDAQLIEVKLSDAFRFGVDWTSLRENVASAFTSSARSVSAVSGEFGSLAQGVRTITISGTASAADSSTTINTATDDVAMAVEMMQRYGDVVVLSNPSIRSKHGQPALISVGTSSTYVSDTRVVTTGNAGGAITSQEIQTSQVFDGLMIGVVPFIDSEGGISLSVHPVQSKVDPLSLALVDAGGNTKVTLPIVDLKSMVTQLKVRSGDAVIMGGLIDQNDFRSQTETPGLGRIPVLGNLFKQRSNQDNIRELVLVLKVTLL